MGEEYFGDSSYLWRSSHFLLFCDHKDTKYEWCEIYMNKYQNIYLPRKNHQIIYGKKYIHTLQYGIKYCGNYLFFGAIAIFLLFGVHQDTESESCEIYKSISQLMFTH